MGRDLSHISQAGREQFTVDYAASELGLKGNRRQSLATTARENAKLEPMGRMPDAELPSQPARHCQKPRGSSISLKRTIGPGRSFNADQGHHTQPLGRQGYELSNARSRVECGEQGHRAAASSQP